MGNDIVVEWQPKVILRRLAGFSSEVVEHLGLFKLKNEKTPQLEAICEEMKQIFTSVALTPDNFLSMTEWYQSSVVMRYIFSTFTEEGDTPEGMGNRLNAAIETIQQADDIIGARHQVEYLRDKFYELSRKCRAELQEPFDRVI